MRSVIGALLLQGSRGLSTRVDVRPRALSARTTGVNGCSAWRLPCVGNTVQAGGVSTEMLPWIGAGDPVPHGRQDGQASSVLAYGQPTRPRSPLRRCFKPRPPLSAGGAGFASGCRSRSEALNFEPQATVRPLVRMPTDRHTATGTCEFGRAADRANRNAL